MIDVLGFDLVTVLISSGIFFLLALLLYVFSVYGVREKTYEEALEEQRKRNEASLFQPKSEKGDKYFRDKKFKKPWGKRAKEKHLDKGGSETSGNESGPLTHNEHVVFKSEAEVIPSDFDPATPKTAAKSKKNKKSSKPILVNKDEGSPKKEKPSEADNGEIARNRSNSFSLTRPRDEVELKHLQEILPKEENNSQEPKLENEEPQDGVRHRKKAIKTEEKVSKVEVESEIKSEIKKEVSTPVQTPVKKQKKGKSDTMNISGDSVPGSQLAHLLKNSILSDVEIQQLIDILLNRQQGGNAEWTRKGDPVVVLKKQLQEKEQALEDEQRLTQTASSKLKEVRSEFLAEKTRFSHMERQLNMKIQNQQQEIQSLHNRICHTHEQHVAETSSLQNQMQQAQATINEERISLQRLKDDNNRLKETLSIREAEASNLSSMQHLQLEVEKLRGSQEKYESRQASLNQANNDLRCQIDQLTNIEATHKQEEIKLKQHITDLTNKINQIENTKQNLLQDIQNLQSDSNQKESKYAEAQGNLLTLEKTLSDGENKYKEIHSKFDSKATECENLQKSNNTFQTEISDLKNVLDTTKKDLEKVSSENKSLSDDLKKKIDELSAKQDEIKHNGDVNNENSISIDKLEALMQEKEKTIVHLKDELNKSLSSVDSYKEDLDQQKQKNNELREKNWKIMDALSLVEKTSSNKLNQYNSAADEKLATTVAEEQNRFKKSYQKLLPSVNIDNNLKFNDWLSEFETEALKVISQKQQEAYNNSKNEEELASLKERLSQEEDGKLKAETQCQNYKSSLMETESMLQKLQDSVETAENSWKDKLLEREKEFQEAIEEKQVLLSKISQVQASQDMQSELKNLESKLQSEELEKKNLAEKYDQVDNSAKELQEKLEEVTKEMEELQKEKTAVDDLAKEVEEVKSQLEKEKKTSKDLSTQVVKLNSLVKIGQDSLKAESNLVDKLNAELQQFKTKAANGDSSHTNEVNSRSPIKEGGSSKK